MDPTNWMDSTKLKIVRSFINLCTLKSPFEVTINEIIDLSGISKGTFYNNFSSKDDIVNYVLKIVSSIITKDFNFVSKTYTNEDTKVNDIIEFFADSSLDYIYENREIIKGISTSPYLSGFWILSIKNDYLNALKQLFPNVSEFNLSVFIYYVIGITHTWICSPLPKEPQVFKKQFKSLLKTKAIDLINNQE